MSPQLFEYFREQLYTLKLTNYLLICYKQSKTFLNACNSQKKVLTNYCTYYRIYIEQFIKSK